MHTLPRRALSISGCVLAFLFLLLVSPILLLGALLLDITRRTSWGATRTGLFIFVFLLAEICGIVSAATLWLCRCCGAYGSEAAWRDANFRLQCTWAQGLTRAGLFLFQSRVSFACSYTFGTRPFMLLMRHASLLDTMLPACYIAAPHNIQLRYVMKKELLWDPCLDIVGQRLPNCFIDRHSEEHGASLQQLGRLAVGLTAGEGVLIYPEGTRYSPQKRARILARLRSRGGERGQLEEAERLSHTLPPHTGGVLALLEAAPQCDVVICAHRGLESASRLPDLMKGAFVGKSVEVIAWHVPREMIPQEKAAQAQWLAATWDEVNHFVAHGTRRENSKAD